MNQHPQVKYFHLSLCEGYRQQTVVLAKCINPICLDRNNFPGQEFFSTGRSQSPLSESVRIASVYSAGWRLCKQLDLQ